MEQLSRDAGYNPLHTWPLESAALQESLLPLIFAVGEGIGPFVYRFAPIDQL